MGVDFVVIIPCYRRFDLLEKCVATVPDAPSIQVLIIDDASPIEDFEAFKLKMAGRNNVKLFQNAENHGAGYSRNFGLKYARDNIRGEGKQWIVFSDDDDAFTEDAFDIFQSHKDSTADIIYFQADFVDYRENGDSPRRVFSLSVLNREKALTDFLNKRKEKPLRAAGFEPWAKMLSKDFIEKNGFLFHETMYMNDAFFLVDAGLKAEKIDAFKEKVYIYNMFENSVCRVKTIERSLVGLNENCALHKLYISHKGYAIYAGELLQKAFQCIRMYGIKNAKDIFAVLKTNDVLKTAVMFYCIRFAYRIVTLIPRKTDILVRRSRYKV